MGLLERVVRERAGLVHHLAGVTDDEQRTDGFALLALAAEFDDELEDVADDARLRAGVGEEVIDARVHRIADPDPEHGVEIRGEHRGETGDRVAVVDELVVAGPLQAVADAIADVVEIQRQLDEGVGVDRVFAAHDEDVHLGIVVEPLVLRGRRGEQRNGVDVGHEPSHGILQTH